MNLVVIGPRVFIRPDALPEMTADGALHLVHDRQQSTMTGTVIAVGDGPESVKKAVDRALDGLVEETPEQDLYYLVEAAKEQFKPDHAVAVGERVIFSPDRGEELIFEKEVLVCLSEDDILAVIEKEQ